MQGKDTVFGEKAEESQCECECECEGESEAPQYLELT